MAERLLSPKLLLCLLVVHMAACRGCAPGTPAFEATVSCEPLYARLHSDLQGISEVVPDTSRRVSGAALSPDGRTIAAVYHQDYQDPLSTVLLAISVATGETWRLTGLTISPLPSPFWSPDSRLIGFPAHNVSTTQIRLVNADGTDRYVLTEGNLAAWSPDGQRIAVAESVGVDGANSLVLRIVDASTGQGYEVFRHEGRLDLDAGLAWSPGGKYLALGWGEDDPYSSRLYLLDLTTLETRPLTEDEQGTRILGWTGGEEWLAVSASGEFRFVHVDGQCSVAPTGLDVEGALWWSFSGQSNRVLLGHSYPQCKSLYVLDLRQALGPDFPERVLSCPEPSE